MYLRARVSSLKIRDASVSVIAKMCKSSVARFVTHHVNPCPE
jgi:hypothetical protein